MAYLFPKMFSETHFSVLFSVLSTSSKPFIFLSRPQTSRTCLLFRFVMGCCKQGLETVQRTKTKTGNKQNFTMNIIENRNKNNFSCSGVKTLFSNLDNQWITLLIVPINFSWNVIADPFSKEVLFRKWCNCCRAVFPRPPVCACYRQIMSHISLALHSTARWWDCV